MLEEERGVSVSNGPAGDYEKELLVSVQWGSDLVQIKSTAQSYTLNIRAVDPAEIEDAKKALQKMNHDHRFKVIDV
ncbi:MAG: hypothetical protein ACYCZA_13730 [Thiobacillus sp.]